MKTRNLKSLPLLLIIPVLAYGQTTQKVEVPTSQPTASDVQKLIDAKEYPSAIKLSGKLLSLRGTVAAGMSRFELTMLKGDAQAGQKLIPTAVATYKSAAMETQDPQEQALAHWTAELFHTAGSTLYTPKMLGVAVQRRGPFDLMNMDQRKKGFGALLDDELSALEPKLKTAGASQSIVQIWPVLQQVVDLSQLDEIANSSDDKTAAIASGLLDHSRNLLTNLLKEYWARLGDIDQHANETTTSQIQGVANGGFITQSITRKNGLSDSNVSELKDMIATSHKIHVAAEQLMKFAKNQKEWDSILADANRVAGRASDVLNTDYTGTDSQINNNTFNNGYSSGTGFGSTGGYGGGYSHPSRPTSRPTKTMPTSRP